MDTAQEQNAAPAPLLSLFKKYLKPHLYVVLQPVINQCNKCISQFLSVLNKTDSAVLLYIFDVQLINGIAKTIPDLITLPFIGDTGVKVETVINALET